MKTLFGVKWGIKFFTSLVGLTPDLKQAVQLKKNSSWEEYKPFVDKRLVDWLNMLMKKGQVEIFADGKEKIPQNEPVIYTPNHSSMFDVPAMALSTPKPPIFLAKSELGKIPFISKWMWVLDCVFVDRENKDNARSSLHEAIDMVNNGRSIVIFPEGTRSKTGELGEFRGGAMKIAMETGAKIVPVLIEGSRDRLENPGSITPGKVFVTFLDPIETKGLTKDDFYNMPAEIRQILQNERDRQRSQK